MKYRQAHSRLTRHVSISLALLGCLMVSELAAQSTWEVTPYRTRVWWTVGEQPSFPAAWRTTFPNELDTKLRTVFRAIWQGTVEPAPGPARSMLLYNFDQLTRETMLELEPELRQLDKLFLVAIQSQQSTYRIRVRELDCRIARLGPIERAETPHLSDAVARVAQLIESAFSPVVRVERSVDKQAFVRLRAGALIRDAHAPGTLQPGDLLLPFDRRVGPDGSTQLKDIRAIDWTYLEINSQGRDKRIHADIVSGYRQPLRSKRSRRQEQLGIRARPTSEQSTIRLRSRASNSEPLIGYEIHEKGVSATEFVGYTDFRGELAIPRSHRPIRILLVKSGDRVTAKLPIVPGLRDVVTATMLDDRQRVETDGFLSGIQIALVDLVARRESLTSRIRARLSEGEVAAAQALFETFRELPTESDFRRQIQQQQQALNVTDPQLRRRIDTMFVDAYRTLGQYLDPDRLRELEREIESARPSN